MANGTVSQVIGSTFDAQFPEDSLPEIYNAVEVNYKVGEESVSLFGEVQQHLGGGQVRAVALGSTDGLTRGETVVDTGAPVSVPVGEEVLGVGVERPILEAGVAAGQQDVFEVPRRRDDDPALGRQPLTTRRSGTVLHADLR